MALISCSECQGKVSDRAPSCPHCGNPLKAVTTVEAPRRWETCQIEADFGKKWGMPTWERWFWANATSPLFGTFVPARSTNYTPGFIVRMRDHPTDGPDGKDNNTLRAF